MNSANPENGSAGSPLPAAATLEVNGSPAVARRPALEALLLEGFDDPRLSQELWARLLPRGETDTVFLTWEWQRTWWEVFGRGQLLLTAIERDGEIVALAPLFCDGGMVFFVGSGGSDYLDFIGDFSDANALDLVLQAARGVAHDFLGFRFYHVPDHSWTGERLRGAAARLGLAIFDEGDLPAPAMDLAGQPEAARRAIEKSGVLRDERTLRRDGELVVCQLRTTEEVLPCLPAFFEQHAARRAASGQESIFTRPEPRRFYERLAERAAREGWLRFTRMDWNGQVIALHFGYCRNRQFFYGLPTFAVNLARRSPGSVLLRHVLLAAVEEGATLFDFGLGDELYKSRFATHVNRVRTWGLYPASNLRQAAVKTESPA